jgi:3-oxoacyl-[acyl-carrier-protein] synthase III
VTEMPAFIAAVAYSVPENIVTNDQLQAENPDWDMQRIAEKTGILSRHIADADETASDLGYAAAEKLLKSTGFDRSKVDALLFCTQSPDYALPTSACLLQHRLGLSITCAALDFNQGCSGYVYGLYLAKALISSGMANNVLLITGETYSKYIHPRDRSVRVLFGDAGAATLISSSETGAEIGAFQLGTDGSGANSLIIPAGGARKPRCAATSVESTDENGSTRTEETLFMDGQDLFAFTLKRIPQVVDAVLSKANLGREDIDWFLFHQANTFMNESLRTKMKLAKERVPLAMQDIGNTVSNTLPIVMNRAGRTFQEADNVMLVGFGVGLSWGACMLKWGPVQLV